MVHERNRLQLKSMFFFFLLREDVTKFNFNSAYKQNKKSITGISKHSNFEWLSIGLLNIPD